MVKHICVTRQVLSRVVGGEGMSSQVSMEAGRIGQVSMEAGRIGKVCLEKQA